MSDFGGVLLGGDLLGRGRGVIEVTKRGEVNIPGIPAKLLLLTSTSRRSQVAPIFANKASAVASFCQATSSIEYEVFKL